MARPATDLKLRKTDAAPSRKRSRRDRKRPDPHPALKVQEQEAAEFVKELPVAPAVVQERRRDTWLTMSPHNDQQLWELQLCQAFGTRSSPLLTTFINQLSDLVPSVWDEDYRVWKTDETEWNALLALVADHQPKNAAQAALAAQMAATHLMTMRASKAALNNGGSILCADAALASRLARTYASQCGTMQMLKGERPSVSQSIHVTKEEHIHYHNDRGASENGNQCHATGARTGSTAASSSLSGPD